MKYVDEFRSEEIMEKLIKQLFSMSEQIKTPIRIMEVCGSHTMAIGRFAIREQIPDNIILLSGPGCPVCVTSSGYIDMANDLALKGITVCSFGDLLRIPGSSGDSLSLIRAKGGSVEVVYSAEQALELAKENPDKEIVFLAIGFESTIATVLAALDSAVTEQVDNFRLLVSFKQMVPALNFLLKDPELDLDGMILPPHVTSIIGSDAYCDTFENSTTAGVVAGFEPVDILAAILKIGNKLKNKTYEVENIYRRGATSRGNIAALRLMELYLEPTAAEWRGLGGIENSGLKLRSEFEKFDAIKYYNIAEPKTKDDHRCRCGEVLRGKISPQKCAMFNTECTPEKPLGACMVSEEGACAAHYRYNL